MFQASELVDADTSMMLELRGELGDACKGVEKVLGPDGSSFERLVLSESSSLKDSLKSGKELRDSVAATLGVMIASDVFLNKKHAAQMKPALQAALEFIGKKLGVTQADVSKVAPKLGSQINEVLRGENQSKKGNTSEAGSKRKAESEGAGVNQEPKPKAGKQAQPRRKRKAQEP